MWDEWRGKQWREWEGNSGDKQFCVCSENPTQYCRFMSQHMWASAFTLSQSSLNKCVFSITRSALLRVCEGPGISTTDSATGSKPNQVYGRESFLRSRCSSLMDHGDGETPLTAQLSAVEPFYPVTLAEEEVSARRRKYSQAADGSYRAAKGV